MWFFRRSVCAGFSGLATLALVFSGTGVACASDNRSVSNSGEFATQWFNENPVLTDVEVDAFSRQVADGFVVLFRDVIKNGGVGYYVDQISAVENGFAGQEEQLEVIVANLNGATSNPYTRVYSSRSWGSFGECVVTGVLGFSPFQIDYNLLGKYIYEKAWNKVADLLQKYARREIQKKAGDIVLKQIIKSTPLGFAAWLGVYATGCAAKEAWNWWRA